MDTNDSTVSITARGPAAEGRLPLAEVARLCGEFQANLERIALTLNGATTFTGRRPQDIVDAVRVTFTGFRSGSAVLDLALPPTATDGTSLVEEALAVLVAGVSAVTTDAPLPEAFGPQVLDGMLRFTGGIGTDITEIVVSRGPRVLIQADEGLRRALRETRRRVRHADTTIVGLLHMSDFAPSALRCRIDTVDSSVTCTFDESLTATVLNSLNGLVVASGTGEFTSAGTVLRSLDLADLQALPRPAESTLDQLAAAQHVAPWPQTETGLFALDAGLGDGLTDAEFDAFLEGALHARGEN